MIALRTEQRLPFALAVAALLGASVAPVGAAPAKKKRVTEREMVAAAAALEGTDEAAAAAAAATLGEVANPSATQPLLEALSLGLAPSVGLAALAALGARADAAALPVLEAYLSVRSRPLRAAAVRAAGAVPGGTALVLRGLDDPGEQVRAAAAEVCAEKKLLTAAPRLVELLVSGEGAAANALGDIADAEIARAVAERIGQAPETLVGEALGRMLLRDDFGPDSLRVEVVRALGKVPKGEGLAHLAAYIASVPEKPRRDSRDEAEKILGDNL